MSESATVVALCGSLRRESLNRKLLTQAVRIAERQGARVDRVDLRELALPLYDGDLEAEQGLPPGAVELKQRISGAAGLLVACPEYNHSIPGMFKNAIDWAARGANPFAGKVVALMGASTGPLGSVRCLQHLRQVFMARGAWIVPALVTISNAAQAFDDTGLLKDATLGKGLEDLVTALLGRL